MDGALKATMPMITSAGQQQKQQMEEAAKAEEEAIEKKQQEEKSDRAGLGLNKIMFGLAIAVTAVAVVAAAPAVGALAAAVAVDIGLGAIATYVSAAAIIGTQAVGYSLYTMGVSDILEGAQDVIYDRTGNTEANSINVVRDTLFRGNVEAYENAKSGLMLLSTFLIGASAPYMALVSVQQSMKIPYLKFNITKDYSGTVATAGGGTVAASRAIPKINVEVAYKTIPLEVSVTAEQAMQLSMMQSGGGGNKQDGSGPSRTKPVNVNKNLVLSKVN